MPITPVRDMVAAAKKQIETLSPEDAHARAAADLFVLLFLRHGLARAKRGVVVDQEHHENRRHGGGEYR